MSDQNIATVRRLTQEGFVGGKVDVVDDVVAETVSTTTPCPARVKGGRDSGTPARWWSAGSRAGARCQDDYLGRRRHGGRELDLPGNPHR